MPKKHFTDYTKQAQVSQVRVASPAQDGNPSSSSSSTVNERLEQLRREQSPRATVEHRNAVSAVVSTPTVPPNLRHLLAIPDTLPPRPKRYQFRQRTQDGEGRRAPPGPPAPVSWLHTSRYAPRNTGQDGEESDQADKRRFFSSSSGGMRRARGRYNLGNMDRSLRPLPRPGSLMDIAMKAMARDWEWIVEYEQLNLATLPVALKSTLLSYIALYGPDDGIGLKSLKTLFLDDSELEGATGCKELEILDLSGLLGYPHSISLTELQRFWGSATPTRGVPKSEPDPSEPGPHGPPESWEDATDPSASALSLKLPKSLISRFPTLTVLSLSNPSPTVSWPQLLSLSTHLHTLTHLSLAHWPAPSMTPNATTAYMESKHGRVSLGASTIYSAMDDDWHEAASILRRFSNNTYCLRYLDLEGCNDWLPALIWSDSGDALSDQWATDRFERGGHRTAAARYDAAAASRARSEGPGWNTSWAQLTHVNISQGWLPTDTAAVRALPSGSLQIELLNYLRAMKSLSKSKRPNLATLLLTQASGQELQTYQVKRWLEKEKESRRIEGIVRALRSSAGGKWVEFEHGWDPHAAVARDQTETPPDIAVVASRVAMEQQA